MASGLPSSRMMPVARASLSPSSPSGQRYYTTFRASPLQPTDRNADEVRARAVLSMGGQLPILGMTEPAGV
jgi:hypothetical protein